MISMTSSEVMQIQEKLIVQAAITSGADLHEDMEKHVGSRIVLDGGEVKLHSVRRSVLPTVWICTVVPADTP